MHTARFAPGVIGQIMDGERPARVPDNVIDELKAGEHNGIIALPKKPQLDPRAWLSDERSLADPDRADAWPVLATLARRRTIASSSHAALRQRAAGRVRGR